jgi:hypothetical protein
MKQDASTAASSAVDGSEMNLPELRRVFDVDILVPCLVYFAFFQFAGVVVRRTCWNNANGFKY